MIDSSLRGVPQKGYKYLLQKNAKCPFCAGMLKRYWNATDVFVRCEDCKTFMRIKEPSALAADELIVEVI